MRDALFSRRRFVTATAGTAVAVGLAGCTDGGDGTDTETGTPTGTDTGTGEGTDTGTDGDGGGSIDRQRVSTYLNADPAADNFDGEFVDETGSDQVVVDVGAPGNQGNFAFAPPAIEISTGTTIEWQWTGEGGQHNVDSVADDSFEGQFLSDFEFESELTDAAGATFTQSFDETGVGTYYCEPHQSLGMKGGFVVVE